jgi:tetratricopeptide (TPR) repeat protein
MGAGSLVMDEFPKPRRRIPAGRALALCIALLAATSGFAAAEGTPATFEEIQQAITKGDLAKAQTQLEERLKASPGDPNALNLLGVVEAREGKYRAAESHFRKATAAAPDFAVPYLNLGHLYQENVRKDPDALRKAAAVYDRLLKRQPTNLEATYQSAYVLWQLGSFRASLDRLSSLPPDAQERSQALALRCGDYAGLKSSSQALIAAERLLNRPELAEADVLPLVSSLLARHQEGVVIKLLEGLRQRHLGSSETLHQLAALYEQKGQYRQARAALEQEALLKPVSVPLLIDLARNADKQKDYEGALGYLAHARDLAPDNAGVHFFFGIVCVENNLLQEAYTSLRKAVQLDPSNPYYNYALGSVMLSRTNVRESYPYLEKYIELKPHDPRGRLALGAAYFYAHDLDLARKEFEGVEKDPATAAAAHFYLGRLANLQGRFDDAVHELEQALTLNPQYADAYAEMGVLLVKQKKYAEAEQKLGRALALDPNHYIANLNLMMAYQRTGDPRAAAQEKRFEQVRKLRAERQQEFLRTIEVRPYE